MSIGQEAFADVEIFFARWLSTNERIFREEIKDKNIGDTEDLANSFSHELRRLGEGYLQGEHSFLTRGRFVDMGVGRGHGRGDLTRSDGDDFSKGRKGRKPKKWYSRAFYGRLNDLMGATGAKLSEKAIQTIKKTLPKTI